MRGELADLLREPRHGGRDRVVVAGLDAHDARTLARAEPHREHLAERDRHLAEDIAGLAFADHALDPVDELDGLDTPFEQAEERALAPSCAAYSPGMSVMSAAARASRSRSSPARAAKIPTSAISSAVTIDELSTLGSRR